MQDVMEFVGNHTLMSVAWLGLLGAIIYSFFQSATSKVKSVSNHEATMLINKQDAVVIDVRTADEFKKGHIAGAHHIPLTQIQANNFTPIEKFKATPTIVVCESGMRSGTAGKAMVKAGFTPVYSLSGGMGEWTASKLPVTRKK
jgi:rhodanese-related sulfurtransferase